MARYPQQPVKILDPWDGDVLNRHDGQESDAGLSIEVSGEAPPGEEVSVNGVVADRDGAGFRATVTLTAPDNTIEARAASGADRITALYDRRSYKRYRYSVDDNILFLRDIARDKPQSIFDHWYLAFWREMHESYGAKIHLNIYYQTAGFILPELEDRWREEWAANADWLHLSFHALQNDPSRIYRNATADRIARDWELVMAEIHRFATPAVTGDTTTVHWAELTREAVAALYERGIRKLIGIPHFNPDGSPRTSYHLDKPHVNHLRGREAWRDPDTGMTFIACDEVVNTTALDQVPVVLDEQAANPHTGDMIELLMHEQHFHNNWYGYQPQIQDKVRAALDWVSEHDYEPCFWCEGFLGNTKGW